MSLTMQNIPDNTLAVTYGITLMRPTIKIKLICTELRNCRLPPSVNRELFTFQLDLLIYGHCTYVPK